MGRRDLTLEYRGKSIYRHILDATSAPKNRPDFLCYVMGPYTPFDLTYAYSDEDIGRPYIDAELFDPDEHEDMEATLRDICTELGSDPGIRAFIATDIGIPTTREARRERLDETGLSPLDQSIEYATVSDAVIFILDEAGLNAGVASEIGAILGEFNLRRRNRNPSRKPRRRFRIYHSDGFSSASIEEIPHGFGIDTYEYESETDLLRNIRNFVTNVENLTRFEGLELYNRPRD
ncbi:DUF7509 family protein [Halorussus ruber]|uniref:DUF7509 family protein n=1 Tax=Halorussus ruber TaxID=1126238 RepID=UPI001091B06C|nr:hypothetical protein [Halorussus ruber]